MYDTKVNSETKDTLRAVDDGVRSEFHTKPNARKALKDAFMKLIPYTIPIKANPKPPSYPPYPSSSPSIVPDPKSPKPQ